MASSESSANAAPDNGPPPPPVELPPTLLPPDHRGAAKSAPDAVCTDYGLPCPADLTHLCGRREFPAGDQRTAWDAFASERAPGELAAYYKERLGDRGFTAGGDTYQWKLAGNGPSTSRTLEILSPEQAGRHRACTAAPPNARSVVIVAREY